MHHVLRTVFSKNQYIAYKYSLIGDPQKKSKAPKATYLSITATNCIQYKIKSIEVFGKNIWQPTSWPQSYALHSVKQIAAAKAFEQDRKLVTFKHLCNSDFRLFEYMIPNSSPSIYRFHVEKSAGTSHKRTIYKPVSTTLECIILLNEIRLTVFHVDDSYYSQCLVLLLHFWADNVENVSDSGLPELFTHERMKERDERPVNEFMKAAAQVVFDGPKFVTYTNGKTIFKLHM
jgi:hypothetical protein